MMFDASQPRHVLALLVCATLTAQVVEREQGGEKAADGLWLIARAEQGGRVGVMRSFSQGITVDSEHDLWCMVQEYEAKSPTARDLWLYRSDNGGKAWQRVTKAPCPWSSYGAIAGEPHTQILHVGWAGKRQDEAHASALYQRFDADQGVWLGEAEVLQKGVGVENQFSISGLAVGGDGVVTALVATHRRPRQPPWPSGWSSGLMIRRAQAAPGDGGKPRVKWSGPFPVNTNTYAVWGNLQLQGGQAHATYRSSPSHSIIAYRSFSLERQAFDQPRDVEISVKPKTGRSVSNASALVVGPFGGRTVVYPAAASGRRAVSNGQLLVSYAGSGDKWQTTVLCEDPKLRSGNLSHEHFALVRGPGSQAIALFSLVNEGFRVLYRRTLDSGKPMEPARVVARSKLEGAYKRIVGMRDGRIRTGVWAVVSGDGEGAALGARAILAPRPVKTRWQ